MLEKAASLPADEVFIDLEDAVAPIDKNDATRDRVVRALTAQSWQAQTLGVRVNAVSTKWCYRDILAVVEGAGEALDIVMLPKVEEAAHVHFAHHLLDQIEVASGLERQIGLEVQIETARGLMNIAAIAAASPRIEALIFGPGDFAASLGIPQLSVGGEEPLYPGDRWHYALSRIIVTARAFGQQAIDGPYAAIRDLDGLRRVATTSRLLGYDGKWAVHPDQIPVCHEVFQPTQEEFDRAANLEAAYAEATSEKRLGAVMYGDEMIDEASRKMAYAVMLRGRASGMTATKSTSAEGRFENG
jgi:citrate lyase subunit beta/citryl-CoA lyase